VARRRETGIATPDALIAATALTHRIPLMTRNRRHFERVARLHVIAPARSVAIHAPRLRAESHDGRIVATSHQLRADSRASGCGAAIRP
jgi:hypothetical protein